MMNVTKGKRMKKSVALMLIGLVYTTSMISVRALSRKVDINVDNDTISTMTLSRETDKILDQVGVKLNENDSVDRHDEVDGSLKLDVKRAFDVNVFQNDKKITLQKSSGTVKDILDALGISEEDRKTINFSENQELYPNIGIVIGKKVKIILNFEGRSEECFVPEGSVKDVLNYLGIELSEEYVADADLDSNVSEGMQLSVDHITYNEFKKTEDIPFTTETKRSGLLNNSERKVSRAGKNGVREVVVREKIKNGEVVESKEISSKTILQPVNEIVIVGTRPASKNNNINRVSHAAQKINNNNSNVAKNEGYGKRCVSGSATAYTGGRGAKTSTGTTPVEGVTVAVDPKMIPYGSKVKVVSNDGKVLFNGIASDTGAALRRGSAVVDIYMNSTKKCFQFGRKNVKVYY